MSFRRQIQSFACRIFCPGRLIRRKYEAFKILLSKDTLSHDLMARLENSYHEGNGCRLSFIQKTYDKLSEAIAEMIDALDAMAFSPAREMRSVFRAIDDAARSELKIKPPDSSPPYVFMLHEAPTDSEALTGGKASNLSKIIRDCKLPVPGGFVLTSNAFNYFLDHHGLRPQIDAMLAGLDIDSDSSVRDVSNRLTALILSSDIPEAIVDAIRSGSHGLRERAEEAPELAFAVRSSAVGEDSTLSFAGQYRTVLNVAVSGLPEAYRQVIASKYSPAALYYRIKNCLEDAEAPMAVLFIRMIDAQAGGVLYSADPTNTEPETLFIYSVWGLGEPLVKGDVVPDVLAVSKKDFKVVKRNCVARSGKTVLSEKRGIESVVLNPFETEQISIDDDSAGTLARWAVELESYFDSSQDIEWCKDRDGNLYILQSRPLRLDDLQRAGLPVGDTRIEERLLLSGGEKAASGVAAGPVAVALQPSDLERIPEGSVLVAPGAPLTFARIVGRLRAVVTDEGSVAGHFASIAREWRVPTIVNAGIATKVLRPGEIVTVDADSLKVYSGVVEELLTNSGGRSPADSSSRKRLRRLLDLISPLNLTDPQSPSFSPENCKSIHDILRFSHEKAVEQMFSLGGKIGRKLWGAKKLVSNVPISLYVMDLGGGLDREVARAKEISVEDINSPPLAALWKGLSHSGSDWGTRAQPIDLNVMGGVTTGEGIISLDSALLASFAVVSGDYMNINIRFGYHFVVVDALCGDNERENYVMLRFEGGGGAIEGRFLRVLFLARVMDNHGFEVNLERDIIHAHMRSASLVVLEEKLCLIGRLLAFTPLLDMRLDDVGQIESIAAEFFRTE